MATGQVDTSLKPDNSDWSLPFALQFGEMLYQLRGALDSCVYDAAILKFGDNPPPYPETWQLPITKNPDDFKKAMRKMKHLPSDIAAIIQAIQGYSGMTCTINGNQYDLGQTLVIVNEWARIDRHRKLHVVGSAFTGGNLEIGSPKDMGVEYCIFSNGHMLEEQNEIARFKIRNYIPGAKGYHLIPKLAFEVMVNEAPVVRFNEIALAAGMCVSAVREMFEKHFGIVR